jgi:PAS domain S-box-containing protein
MRQAATQLARARAGPPLRTALAIWVGVVTVYALWILFQVGGERTTLVVDDIGNLVVLALAAVLTLRRASISTTRSDRIGWLLLGISFVVGEGGSSQRAYYEIILSTDAPAFTLGSIALSLAGPLEIGGVLLLCGRGLGGLRPKLLLDGGLVASALLVISWLTVLRATYEVSGSQLAVTLALVGPVTDVVAAVIGLATLSHSRHLDPAQLLVVSGMILFAVTESMFSYLITAGQYVGAQLVDALWFGGYLLFVIAALAARGPAADEGRPPARWQIVLPYVPLAAASALALSRVAVHQPMDAFTVAVLATMVVLVLARQLMAVAETQALAGRLNVTVEQLAETALRWKEASNERAILIESAPVGICQLSTEGRMLSANGALQLILRRERDEMVGHSLRELLAPDGGAARGAFDPADGRMSGEARFLRGDDTVAWCSVATVAVPGAAGAPKSFISIVEDVNDRRLEAERAAAVQRQLLPQGTLALEGYELVGTCLPAENVAGDFYDWVVDDGHLDITVADVMGKGMGAALVMAALRTALRASPAELGPARRITRAAETMALGLDGLFVTAFQGRLDLRTGRLRYVDAGHGYCILRLACGELVHLAARSLPLGVQPGAEFSEGEVRLEPGDSMLLYSDGLVETENGTEPPEALLPELEGARDAAEVLDRLIQRVPGRLADDVTVVILRRLPEAATAAESAGRSSSQRTSEPAAGKPGAVPSPPSQPAHIMATEYSRPPLLGR